MSDTTTMTTDLQRWNPKDPLIKARLDKLERWRSELGLNPYGQRVEGIIGLADARAAFNAAAHEKYEETASAHGEDESVAIVDDRPRVVVAGRVIQHRAMGKLTFLVIRDDTDDLQISLSKAQVDEVTFKVAKKLDYGDIVVASGPMGQTQKGEICVWADQFEVHCKSLTPPPEKYHGLTDAETRYRQRYVDMYSNPETMQTMKARSAIVARTRSFMNDRSFLEVETPMLQPIAGGAAARPFMTQHNALDMQLFMRIAPELYLKRLLVGGMPRVYEINRNFRNEGLSRRHNPEFTMMEVYEAFGDCWTMLELTESLLVELAAMMKSMNGDDSDSSTLPFGEMNIDYARPFRKVSYGDLFAEHVGCAMEDEQAVRDKAASMGIEDAATRDHWLLVNELFEERAEGHIDPTKPTFVTDFPSAVSPLTRPQPDAPHLSYRWELFIAGMELANSYTELNDPDIQLRRFTEQLDGADEEDSAFRTLDEDFIHALRVGMPPAGGLGLGIDRVVMLMTNQLSIRDVILFPLMKPEDGASSADDE